MTEERLRDTLRLATTAGMIGAPVSTCGCSR
jgi:hypothetical protein